MERHSPNQSPERTASRRIFAFKTNKTVSAQAALALQLGLVRPYACLAIHVMQSSINTITDIETLYARLGERDYEAVMSYLADTSPLADRSPYHGIAGVRSGVFERLTAGFDKLAFDADEIFEHNGGARAVALGYYYFKFHGQVEERKAEVAHIWTIRSGRVHQVPAIPRHAPGRRRRGSRLTLQAMKPNGPGARQVQHPYQVTRA